MSVPSTCVVNGVTIAYHQEGEGTGETILLIHGITTYSFIWRKISPLLSTKYHVISIDLQGCGDSDKTLAADYSLPHHVEIIRAFIDELGIEKLHIVGHDVGGGVAQLFAVKYPECLYDIVLINSVAHDFWPVQPIIAIRTPIIRQLAMASLDIGAFRLLVRRGLYHKERLDNELMEHYFKPMRTKEGRRAFLHFADCLNNRHLVEIESDLRKIAFPALIIRGDADVYLSAAIADKLHADIPSSRIVHIPTGGHYLQEDEPELIAEALLTFYRAK